MQIHILVHKHMLIPIMILSNYFKSSILSIIHLFLDCGPKIFKILYAKFRNI